MKIVTAEQESWLTLFRSRMNQPLERGTIVDQAQKFRASRPSAAEVAADPEAFGVARAEFAEALQRQQDLTSVTAGDEGRTVVERANKFRASRPSPAELAADPLAFGVGHEELAEALQRQQDLASVTTGDPGLDALLHSGRRKFDTNALESTAKMLALARPDAASLAFGDDSDTTA